MIRVHFINGEFIDIERAPKLYRIVNTIAEGKVHVVLLSGKLFDFDKVLYMEEINDEDE